MTWKTVFTFHETQGREVQDTSVTLPHLSCWQKKCYVFSNVILPSEEIRELTQGKYTDLLFFLLSNAFKGTGLDKFILLIYLLLNLFILLSLNNSQCEFKLVSHKLWIFISINIIFCYFMLPTQTLVLKIHSVFPVSFKMALRGFFPKLNEFIPFQKKNFRISEQLCTFYPIDVFFFPTFPNLSTLFQSYMCKREKVG